MIKLKTNIMNIKNPNTGLFEDLPTVVGASAYDLAVKKGYRGTEEEWIKDISGSGGYVESANYANFALAFAVDKIPIGNSKNGVFINSDGKPEAVDITLKNSCTLNATDDHTVKDRCVVTTLALKNAIKGLDKIKDSIYNKCILPSVGKVLEFNGSDITPNWLNYNPETLKITGVGAATNAGTYTAIFTPIAPYFWLDGTDEPRSLDWTINKANSTMTVSTTEVSLNNDHLTQKIEITRLGDGVISASSSNTNIARVELVGDTLTITGDDAHAGTAIIVINVSDSDNYKAPPSVTITVTANYANTISEFGLSDDQICTWADGTDKEIGIMLEAHYNGLIDIGDYWSVGDSRIVKLNEIPASLNFSRIEAQPEQELELVIIGINHDNLVDAHGTKNKAAITVWTKNALSTNGVIDSRSYENHIYGLWSNCDRKAWFDTKFINALPSTFSSYIKEVTKKTYNYGADTALDTGLMDTNDKIFVLSEFEVFGTQTFNDNAIYGQINTGDGKRYEYLKSSSNLIKDKYRYYLRNLYIVPNSTDSDGRLICTGESLTVNIPSQSEINVVPSHIECGIVPAFCL